MYEKFEINQTKIKGSCQSGRKVVTQDSKSDLPLSIVYIYVNVACLIYVQNEPVTINHIGT